MLGVITDEEPAVRQFLAGFRQVVINPDVAERAFALRRLHKMRLPDAIVWASAQYESALLVTRKNVKDYPPEDPGVRIPYSL